MVVDHFDVYGSEVGPPEADSPLVVDTDAVCAFAVSAERFEAVPRWIAEVRKALRGEDPRDTGGSSHVEVIGQFANGLVIGKPFGEIVFEPLHEEIVARKDISCKRAAPCLRRKNLAGFRKEKKQYITCWVA